MKNVLLITCAILVANSAFAVVTNEEIMSKDFLNNHGHSKEMTRLIHLQNDQINGHCSESTVRDRGIYDESKGMKVIRNIIEYIDPGVDNGKFMRNDIDFESRYDNI